MPATRVRERWPRMPNRHPRGWRLPAVRLGGAEGTRTPDPLHAMEVRYQLRHSPAAPAPRRSAGNQEILANGHGSMRNRPRRSRGAAAGPPSTGTSTVAQWQLSSTASTRPAVSSQPSSPASASLRAAPWVTTMPVSPGARAAAHSSTAGTIRPRRRRLVSAPGTPAQPLAEADAVGDLRGTRATASSQVIPVRSPTENSRSRASCSTSSPQAAATCSAVCAARARSEDHSRAGRSAAT